MKPVNIGLLGLGTVGGGTAAVLQDNAAEISRRLGREVRISAVCDLSEEKARQICPSAAFVKDPFELVAREDVDVVVELFGGTGIAKDAVLKAIENGKHIVTANKKLLAEYGNEIFPLAEEKNVMVQFEAAVAGGIPIIKALREGLAANRIRSIAGIISHYGYETEILAASFKQPAQIDRAILAGAHSITVSPSILREVFGKKIIKDAVQAFSDDWSSLYGGKMLAELDG